MEDLTPLYRIEYFLDAIVNGTVCPYSPLYRVEYYLAKLAGSNVAIPEPLYRIEFYLAKLCGEDVAIPEPLYRNEFYLAAACGEDVEVPEPLYRIEYWLNQMASNLDWATFTGNIIQFNTKKAHAVQSAVATIEPVQSGSGDPSPDNVRPITGWANANLYARGKNLLPTQMPDNIIIGTMSSGSNSIISATYARMFAIPVPKNTKIFVQKIDTDGTSGVLALGDTGEIAVGTPYYDYTGFTGAKTASFDTGEHGWLYIGSGNLGQTEAFFTTRELMVSVANARQDYEAPSQDATYTLDLDGIRYGGSVDFVTGVMTVTHAMVDLGTLSWNYFAQYDCFYSTGIRGVINHAPFISSIYSNAVSSGLSGLANGEALLNTNAIYVQDTRFTDTNTFQTAVTGQTIVYELATPLTIQLTAQEVAALKGQNTMWADTGDLTVVARGEAIQLNGLKLMRTLLGSNYVNNGTAEDISDEEAASILLGGTES